MVLDHDKRGQVIVIMGLVISLAVLSSVLLISEETHTNLRKAESTVTDTPEAHDIEMAVQHSVTTLITRNNRNGAGVTQSDISSNQESLESHLTNITRYNRIRVDISSVKTISGNRYYNRSSGTSEAVRIDVNENEFRGGIHFDISDESDNSFKTVNTTNATTSGTLEIRTYDSDGSTQNTLYLYQPKSMPYDIAVVTDENEKQPVAINGSTATIDVSTGNLNGYDIEGYTTPTGKIEVRNTSTDLSMTEEYVLKKGSAKKYEDTLKGGSDATYAVIYDVKITTNKRNFDTVDVATHGTTREI